MAARNTYAYLGAGKIKMREVGAAAPFLAVGNASALTFGATTDSKTLQDRTQPGGGTYAKVDRTGEVTVAVTLHDLDAPNLAKAAGGGITEKAAGTTTAEPVVAYKGGTTPLTSPPSTITTVTGVGGTPEYVAGTDYRITPAGLEIPSTSTIPAPVAGAPNIAVTYTNTVQRVMQAIVNSGKEYELLFEGLNEAEQDVPMIVQAYRVKFTPAQAINFLSDDFAALELTGTALPNQAIVANGLSRYWKATVVEPVTTP